MVLTTPDGDFSRFRARSRPLGYFSIDFRPICVCSYTEGHIVTAYTFLAGLIPEGWCNERDFHRDLGPKQRENVNVI